MKHLILAVMMIAMLALVANATPPPAPPFGAGGADWGMTWYDWDNHTGSWSSGPALYDPNAPALAGSGWVVAWNPTTYIDYADIELELWIEMYMVQTYFYTSYQWHRLGDAAETISFLIGGTVVSNNGQWLSLMHQDPDPMTHLYWRHNIFGGGTMGVGGSNNARDIPISWSYRWGTGLVVGTAQVFPTTGYEPYVPDPDIDFLIEDACDHWYEFRGEFDLVYHEADGYYSLTLEGCPSPIL